MKAWLWQFLAGCVKIKIEGLKLLQFISDAAAQGVRIQRLDRDSYSRIYAAVSWRGYRRLLRLARNRPLRIVELSSAGLPSIAGKAVKRLAFTIGMLLCFAALVAVNMFILDVRVTGCTIPGLEARVLEVARAQGLRPGAEKSAVDLHAVEDALMLEIREISFAAVRVNGMAATVTVVEGVQAPPIVDRNTPCNITASRDGVVRKVTVLEGQAKVAVGDAVRRGQVLVGSGVLKASGFQMTHAMAEVMASVWYEGRGRAPLFLEKSWRTGNVAERRRLEFAGYTVPIGGQDPAEFDHYDAEETSRYLLGPGLKGPRLVTTRYYEAYRAPEEQDFDAALDAAVQQALDEVMLVLPQDAQTVGSRTDYDFTDGYIIVRVFIETLENIAVETPVS